MTGGIAAHASESDILTTLYNSTDGADWTNNDNWASTAPVFLWYRVGVNTSGHVTVLWLYENQLRGEIPSELGSLTYLEALYLEENQLTGEIPSELSNLEYLEELFLSGNQLTGCIPSGLQDVPENDLNDLGLEFCSE